MIRFDVRLERSGFRLDATAESDAQVTGLFGHSGCGKTTLLQAIAGIARPRDGRILVDDTEFFSSADRVNLHPEKRRIGFVFQEGRLFPHLNVRDNIRFGYRLLAPGQRRFEPGEIISLLGLEGLLRKRVIDLSGGEQRRVALARALLCSPRLLLLDEPLTGLDRSLRRRVLAYLMRIKKALDIRMLYVSHTYSDLLALADFMCVMKEGRIVSTGRPASLLGEAVEDEQAGPLETVLEGQVVNTAPTEGYVEVQTKGLLLRVRVGGAQAGEQVFVTVRAEEVIIAVDQRPLTSARNVLPAKLVEVRHLPSRAVLTVDAGPRLLVEVTEQSVRELGLEPGRELFLLLKTRSLQAVAIGDGPRGHSA
jgi:molybdate transport system ATP-binding protein